MFGSGYLAGFLAFQDVAVHAASPDSRWLPRARANA